ncbi:helix-hairpin-helix domain-containing protein [Paenibacillus arenilitoris]|uniref:Pathogenicity locus n=1 Tax=Paenibacillus arenilitoris TaxID=2772299 RepID=A0A927CRX7_9BACL|nr:helix-hairpin-helix domain-containing protein [Paenibacillus arenilitoris]MBD2871763.1 Pathogenicity locus [Paenibacillus arenilitoris]
MSTPKLPLTDAERKAMRASKIKLADLAGYNVDQLGVSLQISTERAKLLLALARFQSIPSLGPKLAWHLTELGFYSLEDIKAGGETGAQLVERLEKLQGVWMDPCVEDVMRLAVHHAHHPGSGKQWWDFTAERKSYREKHGYPADRPAKAWHEA